tara:strand:- start:217 stop:369 length:153 start_codon:yes stop_codon:yes gene_type:complete
MEYFAPYYRVKNRGFFSLIFIYLQANGADFGADVLQSSISSIIVTFCIGK